MPKWISLPLRDSGDYKPSRIFCKIFRNIFFNDSKEKEEIVNT